MSIPHPDHNVTRDNQIPASGLGSNTGHGHVWARPDGMKARCGGPSMCSVCAGQLALINAPAQPSGDGQRTPGDYIAIPEDGVEPSKWMRLGPCAAREIIAERDALRAWVASLEEGKISDFEIFHEARVKITELCGDPCLLHTEGLEKIGKDLADLRAQLHAATERADALQRECENKRHEGEGNIMRIWLNALGDQVYPKAHHIDALGKTTRKLTEDRNKALADLTTARDELAKWRDCADRMARALEVAFEHDLSAKAEYKLSGALDAYRAIAGEGAGM